jgi:hypothetical protein
MHGLDVTGYHVINLFIHINAAVLVYLFMLFSFRTPFLSDSSLGDYSRHIAIVTALLFAVHPIQTQAVTYIWQRVASLATMFYMLSLVMYIKWRLKNELTIKSSKLIGIREKAESWLFYALSFISAILAMKTKQIAFTLPVMIVCYELIFFKGQIKNKIIYLLPLILTMLIIPFDLFNMNQSTVGVIGDMEHNLRGNTDLTRKEYLLTSISVISTYVRLIFLPINQSVDYDYPTYTSIFDTKVLASLVFILFIITTTVYMFHRYKDKTAHIRLIIYGVLFFFISLLLEQSVIPLNTGYICLQLGYLC